MNEMSENCFLPNYVQGIIYEELYIFSVCVFAWLYLCIRISVFFLVVIFMRVQTNERKYTLFLLKIIKSLILYIIFKKHEETGNKLVDIAAK